MESVPGRFGSVPFSPLPREGRGAVVVLGMDDGMGQKFAWPGLGGDLISQSGATRILLGPCQKCGLDWIYFVLIQL